jgi:hypothetical protein
VTNDAFRVVCPDDFGEVEVMMWFSRVLGKVVAFEADGQCWEEVDWTEEMRATAADLTPTREADGK